MTEDNSSIARSPRWLSADVVDPTAQSDDSAGHSGDSTPDVPVQQSAAATSAPVPQRQQPDRPSDTQPRPDTVHPEARPADQIDVLRRAKRRPARRGYRRWLYRLTGGAVNVGKSPAELEYEALLQRVRQPLRGDYKIAVLSLKGGVGKTTTVAALGSSLASIRGDKVIAVDANPDLGTLADRGIRQNGSTVRDLLADTDVHRYSDVRAHTSQGESRLEILASEQDPAIAEAFDEQNYRNVLNILEKHYNVILADCGTGISHSVMHGVLDEADALIVVAAPAQDAVRSAAATLQWLSAHTYEELVARTVVVVNSTRPGSSLVDPVEVARVF
ncbi:MAG TPA: MinD/ParA family protein, partial [Aldersonia sp.]